MKHILLIGSGGIASLYGLMMQKAGYRITMVCRSSFEEVRDSGIYVDTKWGSDSFNPSSVLNSLDGFSETVDYIVIATKVLTTDDINQLFLKYSPTAPIVLIQNGLFIEELYIQRFPYLDIISGLAFVCVFRESFTHVRHIDYGRLDLGVYPSGQLVSCNELVESLQSVGVDARVSECIQKQRWEKLVWNAPFNPLSVIYEANTIELFDRHQLESLIRSIMAEVVVCAKVDGIELESSIIDLKIDQTKRMAPYKTSMLLDYENQRPIEIEAILGNVLAFASTHQLPLPTIQALYDELYLKITKEKLC